MLNKVFLIGNLTRDPDVKYLPSGTACSEFRLAVNRRFRSREGEQREETLFIDITTFGKTAEFCGEYLKKGKRILVEGRLKEDTWEAKDGSGKRSKIKVMADSVNFMDAKPTGDSRPQDSYDRASDPTHSSEPPAGDQQHDAPGFTPPASGPPSGGSPPSGGGAEDDLPF